jgi:FAD-linked oxidoreductase
MRRASWHNWAGNVRCTPAEQVRPRSEDELAAALGRAVAAGRNVRVAGSGHSYSPLVSTDGTLISLERLKGIEAVDTQASEVTVWAGTRLRAIGDPLWRHGFSMENLGDTHAQALAGAVGTATHGSGITLGSVSTQVVGLTLMTAAGELVECSEEHEPELFHAARVGLGCLGIVTRLRLRVLPRHNLEMRIRNEELDTVLGEIEDRLEHRHFEFWYWPDTGKVLSRTTDMTERAPTENALERFFKQIVIENGAVLVLSTVARAIPSLADDISRIQAKLGATEEKVDRSYRVLATPRFVKLVESEYSVPAEAGPDCLREVKAWLDASDAPVSFPIEYRYVAADDSYLSPYHGRDSAMIDLQQFKGMPYGDYFAAGEEIFKRYEGRPHWGKLHTRGADELRPLYPRWDDFQAVRAKWDPAGVFMNDHLRGLLGPAT